MADGLNNVDAKLLKLAEEYQASKVRSDNENIIKKDIRETVEKLGVDPWAFQVALRFAKDKTPDERADATASLNRVLSVVDGKEADLFGAEEIAARDRRAQKRADKAAGVVTPRAKADAKSDKNPKSDPKSGGAGKKPKKPGKEASPPADGANAQAGGDAGDDDGPHMVPDGLGGERPETGDEMIARVAALKNAELEQREGAQTLNSVGTAPVDKVVNDGPPKSQSQLSAEALERARLN